MLSRSNTPKRGLDTSRTLLGVAVLLLFSIQVLGQVRSGETNVEQWGLFELTLEGPSRGNPFKDVEVGADFTMGSTTVSVSGFYDGEGVYKIRLMPHLQGEWRYVVTSSHKGLDGTEGSFQCVRPTELNRGPVGVADTFHFAYTNGDRYFPLGTTAYGSMQQPDSIWEQTLASLEEAPFNKVRLALLPHAPSSKQPIMYPYQRRAGGGWDFGRFNPAYFRLFEQRIVQLQALGIEADLFVFHPYDKNTWGFDQMDKGEQYFYLEYVNARLGAFRNVWWSMSNEFDLLKNRTLEDWDGYFQFFERADPYGHLRSIHNAGTWYDHSKPWVTHVSCQTESWWNSPQLRIKYGKPVITDEFCYEGNDWARITALSGEEIVHRFWIYTVSGTYATHGEAFYQDHRRQFFRQGGRFIGQSVAGISFLKEVVDEFPGPLTPVWDDWRLNHILGKYGDEFFLYYLGVYQNTIWVFDELPEGINYGVDIIDTRERTITSVSQTVTKGSKLDLPGKTHMAIRLTKLEE